MNYNGNGCDCLRDDFYSLCFAGRWCNALAESYLPGSRWEMWNEEQRPRRQRRGWWQPRQLCTDNPQFSQKHLSWLTSKVFHPKNYRRTEHSFRRQFSVGKTLNQMIINRLAWREKYPKIWFTPTSVKQLAKYDSRNSHLHRAYHFQWIQLYCFITNNSFGNENACFSFNFRMKHFRRQNGYGAIAQEIKCFWLFSCFQLFSSWTLELRYS